MATVPMLKYSETLVAKTRWISLQALVAGSDPLSFEVVGLASSEDRTRVQYSKDSFNIL